MKTSFTIVELLVTAAIVSILATLSLGAAGKLRRRADATGCAAHLRQLGVASQLYLAEHEQRYFAYSENTAEGKLWFFGLETWGSVGGAEGSRTLDATRGPLYPYIQSAGGVEVCRAFPYESALWKPKFKGASYGYGYNIFLSNRSAFTIERPSETIVFGDSAQVNTFQSPASPRHPMLEEFYMIENTLPTVHFRHSGRAQMLFADGHVDALPMAPGTADTRLPDASVGRIAPAGSMKWLW